MPQTDPVASDGAVLKKTLDIRDAGRNLLDPAAWRDWQEGFTRSADGFICDNGPDDQVQRGVSQTVVLNQQRPEPIIATAWSMAENVAGSRNSDYSLYLDLVYSDNTPLWGQIDPFSVGTHDWEKAQVVVFPEKPVRSLAFHLLLRRHAGRALFREPELRVISPPAGACLFDGVPVALAGPAGEGFQIRDVAAGSDFVRIERTALGLELTCQSRQADGVTFFDATLSWSGGDDRAVTLLYAVPFPSADGLWLHDPRRRVPVEAGGRYANTTPFAAGANGRLSRYPFAAVAEPGRQLALGIDMARPAFFRAGYNASTQELYLAYDIGLTPEKRTARLAFCTFGFDPAWGFRAALARYYEIFPDAFRCRVRRQGLWMPFAKISAVADWRDFGFAIKEGTNETGWDDEHGILTFRYTEPMTWWMPLPAGAPRTQEAALAEARRLAEDKNDPRAQALFTSGYHDEQGRLIARLLDTPWCDGAVWSVNSMPNVAGAVTDFNQKWNPDIRQRLYGPDRRGDLDGEYIDSSEGYVTDELDFRRDHFASAQTPLTYSLDSRRVCLFRGLIAFEYVRAIERDIRRLDKLMMANATPIRLCWLAPLLDVMGTETNWNPGGTWRPLSDAELLYRRALCRAKPYCILMNTPFEDFSHELVERYMKRSLAYGMFPGFFSHNASEGHYFTRPEFYERDRDLFKRYIPLCKRVAEAGWRPVTGARSSNEAVHLERFGDSYLTIYNDADSPQEATITLEAAAPKTCRDLVANRQISWQNRQTTLTLAAGDVAVLDLAADTP
ncbi:MAG: hypothetical protein JW810_12570, partial [Sedimentisphaerales bacterium]|nr:hypothetical protein [Sedimentisphaerales bacterium]